MCGVDGAMGGGPAMKMPAMKMETGVAGAEGGGAPPTAPGKDPSQVAGVAGGGAVAGADALKPILEQLMQAIKAITELLSSGAVGGASGGGAPGKPGQIPTQTSPPFPGQVGGEHGHGTAPGKDPGQIGQFQQIMLNGGGGTMFSTPTTDVAGANGAGATNPAFFHTHDKSTYVGGAWGNPMQIGQFDTPLAGGETPPAPPTS